MKQRSLKFTRYAEIADEIRALQNGYRQCGGWTLSQICKHLSYYYRGSLDGFERMLPWIVRATIGRLLLKGALSKEKTKPGGPTAPHSIFPDSQDEAEASTVALELLRRLEENRGQLHPSALYGELTNDQWKILHLQHSAHHLGFLHHK